MKRIILLSLSTICFIYLFAQNSKQVCYHLVDKPSLDITLLGQWPYVSKPLINGDGSYISYTIEKSPIGKRTLIIKSTDGHFEREFVLTESNSERLFSGDGKYFYFRDGDTLFYLSLVDYQLRRVSKVRSCKFAMGENDWLAYQIQDSKDLVLANLSTGKEYKYSSVTDYLFGGAENTLLLKREENIDNKLIQSLVWITLPELKQTVIWHSSSTEVKSEVVKNYTVNNQGDQLAFIVNETDSDNSLKESQKASLWFYKSGMQKAVVKVNSHLSIMGKDWSVSGIPQFSKNNKWIFFELAHLLQGGLAGPSAVKVNVWSYKDDVLQPEQIRMLGNINTASLYNVQEKFAGVINIDSEKPIRLEQADEKLVTDAQNVTGDYVVLRNHNSVGDRFWWQFSPQPSFFLVSLIDGSRRLIKGDVYPGHLNNFSFSPNSQYFVYWDSDQSDYFSYEIATGKLRNITAAIHTGVHKEYQYTLGLFTEAAAPVAGWEKNDSSLLIYDNYDVWRLSPINLRIPENITEGYGKKHHIKFSLLYGPGNGIQDKSTILYQKKDTLLLTAFNCESKYNGFCRKIMDGRKGIETLTMGPYTYYRTESQIPFYHPSGSNGMQPIRATNAESWIVQREAPNEAPNYYFTHDFKNYIPLSNLHPQTDYNWLNSEHIRWQQSDGTKSEGILYKPENFDPRKKYPIIFHFYRQLSYQMYDFLYPYLTCDEINIPWFVSKGYLVFEPDIYFSILSQSKKKTTGESALNSVVSAAKFLSTLPYVNKYKMGLQGHSFGAGEVNYIISHTKLFAAAAEFSGVSDPISNFLTLAPFLSPIEHSNKLSRTEFTCGFTPWERPDLFTKTSTVLNANKITSPLLITHNTDDNQIQWRQGVELYMALRRLGKPVWLLQYEGDKHSLSIKNGYDYTIRLTQFFDHYLKDSACPSWMYYGIPAKDRGIDNGFDLVRMKDKNKKWVTPPKTNFSANDGKRK